MTAAELSTLVTTVGFPIVCCFALFYMINKQIDKMIEAVNNNTVVIAKLLTKLGVDD